MIKIYQYIKPYRFSVAGVIGLVFLQILSELYLPTLMSDIVDQGIVQGDIPYIWRIGALMLLTAGGGMICAVCASLLAARTAVGFGSILRSRVFESVERFSLHEFDHFGTATLITRTTNDISQMQTVTFMILRLMTMAPIMCVGGIIMAVSQDMPLSVIFIVVVPLLGAVIFSIFNRALPLFRLMQTKIDKLNRIMREGLTGIRVVRAFNRTAHQTARFDEANRDLTDNAIRVNRLMAVLMPAMMLVLQFTLIAIIWFGSIRIDRGQMQVGSLMAFIQYSTQIMVSMIMASMMFILIPRASASALRILEVLDTVPAVRESSLQRQIEGSGSEVAFEHVTFRYPGAEQPAISDISFTAKPGEITAVIGGTGAGKSALIGLIPRFYDTDAGRITLNGVDILEIPLESLRERIGFVPQKSILFSGSVSDNIRFGKPEATDEEVRRAAEIAQADEFIAGMNGAYEAVIEQGGVNVSGGQKQRLAIARALVRQAQIYIFDDSFSALDFKTDARLRAALRREIKAATVLIVAQRVSTVMDADQIVVLNEGQLVGLGSHRALMQTCDVYREIVYSQIAEEELA